MLISKLNTNPLEHQNKDVTIAGVVRASYTQPFQFFLLEDQTGALFCQTNDQLPAPGAHLEVCGTFFVGIPEKCSVPLILLQEKTRTYVGHTAPCSLKSCELAA